MLWAVAGQVPLSMGFSRREYWSGWPRAPLGDLPEPGIEPKSPVSWLAGGLFTTSTTWEIQAVKEAQASLQTDLLLEQGLHDWGSASSVWAYNFSFTKWDF